MKPVLVFDSVNWSPAYDPADPLWNVGGWFREAWTSCRRPLEIRHVLDGAPIDLDDYVGMILSGSPSSAYDSDDWIARLSETILEAVDRRLPTLGVCFGCQLIAQTLGGQVEANPKGWEIGDPEIRLTDAGRADPLFDGIPQPFRAIQSHRDAVTELPDGAEPLAFNAHTAVQAFGVDDFLRAVQFHPEMTPDHLRFILAPRREKILEASGIDIDEVLPNVQPTPESRRIFKNFETHFVG